MLLKSDIESQRDQEGEMGAERISNLRILFFFFFESVLSGFCIIVWEWSTQSPEHNGPGTHSCGVKLWRRQTLLDLSLPWPSGNSRGASLHTGSILWLLEFAVTFPMRQRLLSSSRFQWRWSSFTVDCSHLFFSLASKESVEDSNPDSYYTAFLSLW